MLKAFSTSYDGNIVQVTYSLHVYVDYDSWNEFGGAREVTLPIEVFQPPMQLAVPLPIAHVPADWNPDV